MGDQAKPEQRVMKMEGEVVAKNIWVLHDAAKETRKIARDAETQVEELKSQVAMLRAEVGSLHGTANAAMAMAQGGGSTS